MKTTVYHRDQIITIRPENAPLSKRTIAALLGLGFLMVSAFGISSFNNTNCDGAVRFKANPKQGAVEFEYNRTNCLPIQSPQAKK